MFPFAIDDSFMQKKHFSRSCNHESKGYISCSLSNGIRCIADSYSQFGSSLNTDIIVSSRTLWYDIQMTALMQDLLIQVIEGDTDQSVMGL